VTVTNTGDVLLTAINVTDTRHGVLGSFGSLNPGASGWFTIVESSLPAGTYYDNATAYARYDDGLVSDWDDATCEIIPGFVVPEFPMGTLTASIAMISAIAIYNNSKRK